MEREDDSNTCPFQALIGKQTSKAGKVTQNFTFVDDLLYNAIISNVVFNIAAATFLTIGFIFVFTWVGELIPVWNKFIKSMHSVTCQLEDDYIGNRDLLKKPICEKLYKILMMDIDFMLTACGDRDAVCFLLFERHLIVLSFTVTLFVLSVCWPIHVIEGKNHDMSVSTSPTLDNVPIHSIAIWVDIGIGVSFLPISMFVMSNFVISSIRTLYGPEAENVNRTLVLHSLPEGMRRIPPLREWISKNYPGFRVEAITFAVKWNEAHKQAKRIEYYRRVLNQCHEKCKCLVKVKIWELKYFGALFWYWKKNVTGFNYYKDKYYEAKEKYLDEIHEINQGHYFLDKAFVTLKTINEAVGMFMFHNFRRSSDKTVMMRYAGHANAIKWQNIGLFRCFWLVKACHWAALITLVILFAVARYLLNIQYNGFLDGLYLFVTANIFPEIVLRSTEYLGYSNEANINLEFLRKAYICLVSVLFILPLLNPRDLVISATKFSDTGKFEYDPTCLFLPDSGVYFFNNIVTFALLGNAVRLTRATHMFWHVMTIFTCRTCCEAKTVSRYMERESFWIGERMAWTLVHFTVMMALSISSPLIVIAGMFYLLFAHAVDTFLLYKRFYVVPTVNVRNFYDLCITIVYFATLILQLSIGAFLFRRIGDQAEDNKPLTFSLLVAIPSALLIAYQTYMRHEGPISMFRSNIYSINWKKEIEKQATTYHPPKTLEDEDFPNRLVAFKTEDTD